MNPGPMTRRLMENSPEPTSHSNGILSSTMYSIYFSAGAFHFSEDISKFQNLRLVHLHSQATTFAKLAESAAQ